MSNSVWIFVKENVISCRIMKVKFDRRNYMKETVIIMPGLLQDFIVISNNVILVSPEFAQQLINS